MYGTAFRYMAASNPSLAWSKVNEQLYNDILKEETLPYCVSCHNYGHRTLACAARSKPNQSFRPLPSTPPTYWPDTSPSLATATAQPAHAQQPPSSAICGDYNRRACRHPNCQFQHICNKMGCGGNSPWLPVPQATLIRTLPPLLSDLLPPLSTSRTFPLNFSTTPTNSLLRTSFATSSLAVTSDTVAYAQLGSPLIFNLHFFIPKQFLMPWPKRSLGATWQGPFSPHPSRTSSAPP